MTIFYTTADINIFLTDITINEAGLTQHHLILKDNELFWVSHTPYVRQQPQPKELAFTLLIAVPNLFGSKSANSFFLLS